MCNYNGVTRCVSLDHANVGIINFIRRAKQPVSFFFFFTGQLASSSRFEGLSLSARSLSDGNPMEFMEFVHLDW